MNEPDNNNQEKKAPNAKEKAPSNLKNKLMKTGKDAAWRSIGVDPKIGRKIEGVGKNFQNKLLGKSDGSDPLSSKGDSSNDNPESNQDSFGDKFSDSNDLEVEGTTNESFINKFFKKNKKKIFMIASGAIAFILTIVLIVGAMMKMVEGISLIVGGVNTAAVATANFAQTFSEKTKNLLLYGKFATNEQALFEMILDKSNQFKAKYGVTNIPLVAATLYFDGSEEELEENKVLLDLGDGKTILVEEITDEKLSLRSKYVEEVFNHLESIKVAKYRCNPKVGSDGNITYNTVFISSEYVTKIDESKEGRSCSDLESDLNIDEEDRYIYFYSTEYDEEGYAFRLKNSEIEPNGENLVALLFPELFEEIGVVDPIIEDIMAYYEIWRHLYDEEEEIDECYVPGGIPGEVLSFLRRPIEGTFSITSKFGLRINPFESERATTPYKFHNGIDVVAKQDKTIYAVYDGVVTIAGFQEVAGNTVTIQHTISGETYYSTYHHFKELPMVSAGMHVSMGDPIGIMGTTGKSTGPHLHFGLYKIVGGQKEFINPENLFTGAENYDYICESTEKHPVGSCTLNGGLAFYSFKSKKSFNLMRAIADYENSKYGGFGLMKIDFDLNYFRSIFENKKGAYSKYADKINFDTMTISTEYGISSFADINYNYFGRKSLVEIIGEMDKSAYDSVKVGFNLIPLSLFAQFEFRSSKDMFETLSANNYELIDAIFKYAEMNNSQINEIMTTIDSENGPTLNGSSISIDQGVSIVLKALYSHLPSSDMNNRFENDSNYVAEITRKYLNYRDDLSSTIDNYLKECLIIEIPGWADCIVYENVGQCKTNLKNYYSKAKWYTDHAPTYAGKRVLAYASSLFGKVRYCGACDTENDPECVDIKKSGPDAGMIGKHAFKYSYSAIRCSEWARSWYKEGFNPKWGELHEYTFNGVPYYENQMEEDYARLANSYEERLLFVSYDDTGGSFNAGVAGLDCDGYVNWVLNQTFQVFDNQTFPVMGAVCNSETEYTRSFQFESIPEFKNFGDSVLPLLTPGDILCNSSAGKAGDAYNYSGNSRHVMIYMGFEDKNQNGIGDAGDDLYIIHSGGGGVRVDAKRASDSYWKELNSFATYK